MTDCGHCGRGPRIDNRDADELRRISSTQVVFRYGEEVVVSTFAPLEEQQAANRIKSGAGSTRIQISNQPFFADSVNLTPGMQPAVTLTVLESYQRFAGDSEPSESPMLALGLIGVFGGGALAFVISDTFTRPLSALVEGVHALETAISHIRSNCAATTKSGM